jgi:hypothetical protein
MRKKKGLSSDFPQKKKKNLQKWYFILHKTIVIDRNPGAGLELIKLISFRSSVEQRIVTSINEIK